MDKTVIELSRPIEAHGETIRTLALSEPNLGVLNGIHVCIGDDGAVRLNLGDLQKLVAGMAGIPPSAARKISLADAPKLMAAVRDFFGEFLTIGE